MKRRYTIGIGLLVVLGAAAGWGAWKISHNQDCPPPMDAAAGPGTMQAIRYQCFGGPEVLELANVAKPEPGPGEVLVRVTAASVNPLDWHYMRGEPYVMRLMGAGTGRPASAKLGVDFAGRVEAVGDGVSAWHGGDRVFGSTSGAFGEYLVLAQDGPLAAIPPGLADDEAASVGVAGITALQALRDIARIEPGDKVLVNGASGGVGTFAVQLARAMGAEVHGVCSTRNVELVQSLGAGRVYDYKQESYLEGGERYDAIIDNVGNHSLLANRKVMADDATLVIVGGQPGNWLGPLLRPLGALFINPFVSQNFEMFIASLRPDDLRQLAGFMDRGEVRPHIGHHYALAQVPEAIALSESGRARGKIVIRMD
jgi:NADPH:quinone reductase-like Zn-dependent oxidoreductase